MRSCLAIVLLLTLIMTNSASATFVQTELMLLCDVSGSMDADDFTLQQTGYENAFRSLEVKNLIGQATGHAREIDDAADRVVVEVVRAAFA